jgi:hypothetical protein
MIFILTAEVVRIAQRVLAPFGYLVSISSHVAQSHTPSNAVFASLHGRSRSEKGCSQHRDTLVYTYTIPTVTGHPLITSFEPGEDWFFDYEKRGMIQGVELLPPHAHLESQRFLGEPERWVL